MSTEENLKEAFAGESQANRKYVAFANKAEQDGLKQIARLFRATAEAETIHALAHFRLLGKVKSTRENLEAGAQGEAYEYKSMYPKFLEDAEAEGNKAAAKIFKYALEAERVHHDLYVKAGEILQQGRDMDDMVIYLCPVCGNIELGVAPETCAICGVPGRKFVEF
jgi:rubrerythrin